MVKRLGRRDQKEWIGGEGRNRYVLDAGKCSADSFVNREWHLGSIIADLVSQVSRMALTRTAVSSSKRAGFGCPNDKTMKDHYRRM
ncbi:hypothetical protein AB6A40_003909 [Gnathostoma spinigerum]|uniref:Uncharacterized protein n=1 Tax=Gnathostoma spinigerum TaxID=75299 RepID=A0ABD6EC32_9BILA